MEPDPYDGLLAVARQLKDGKKFTCSTCFEDAAVGYLAPCCRNFLCPACMGERANRTSNMFFQVTQDRRVLCVFCKEDLPENAPLAQWIPRETLRAALTAEPPMLIGSVTDAWNFKLVHGCGEPLVVAGWEACDSLAGGCPKCGRPVSVVGPKNVYSYQMRDLQGRLTQLGSGSSPADVVQLRRDFPLAWRTLHLTELVDALATGTKPDLSLWSPDAVAFLIHRANDIKAELTR